MSMPGSAELSAKSSAHLLLQLLLWGTFLTACGTFEVGVERSRAPQPAGLDESPSPEARTPEPNPLEIAFFWSGEMKGECQTLHINYGGEGAIGQCKQSARTWIPLDDRLVHAQFYRYWLDRFAAFEAQTPGGQVLLSGLGSEEASPAWQRAMGNWGELVWVELETDGRSESWTTALDWRQQSAEQTDVCQALQVTVYGKAQASLAPCRGGEPEAWVEAWLETAAWNQFDVWYYSHAPFSNAEMLFYGIGTLEMNGEDQEGVRRWAETNHHRLLPLE